MLLLSQEFEINNVIKLWDLLFADHDKFTFVYFVCAAMVTIRREQLLRGDFSDCMQLL
jgi:TBC1 domain family member 13